MLLKRLLTIWFLLFTLISSTAWAWSDHADSDDTMVTGETTSNHLLPPWSDDACNDHCDHIGIHIVGLISSFSAISISRCASPAPPSFQIPVTREPTPPFHPPII